jgi:hypothetical protein
VTDLELATLCLERQAYADQRDQFQKAVDERSQAIGAELTIRGTKRVEVQGWIPQLVDYERATLDKIKLLEAGVSTSQIEKGTVTTRSVQVRVYRSRAGEKGKVKPKEAISIPGYDPADCA